MKLFASITKVDQNDDGTIDVFGIASTEARDAQGDIVTKGAMTDALPGYFAHGTGALRAMHQPIAAGYVYKAEVNADGNTEIAAKVVDPVEVLKCQQGVYKGFSIGGSKVPGGYDPKTKTISKMKLTEISLVDRPANPEATITMWKGDDMPNDTPEQTTDITVTEDQVASIDKLADLVNKSAITPEQIVQLVEKEIAKSANPFVIEKGMYGLRTFAELILSIGYMTTDALYEAVSEGDNSPIPEALRSWLTTGVQIFKDMAEEEANELVAQVSAAFPKPVEVVQMGDLNAELRKALTGLSVADFSKAAEEYVSTNELLEIFSAEGTAIERMEKAITVVIEKAGARNSKSDQEHVQTVHDKSVALGAVCAEVAKHDHQHDITKVEGLESQISKLQTDLGDLQKRYDELSASPAAPKAFVLNVQTISKGADSAIKDGTEVTEPSQILKADGSVDHDATALLEIQKVHQSGGQRLLR